MKKLILAVVALAFAFAISSCCDQSKCPANLRAQDKGCMQKEDPNAGEKPYRWDKQPCRPDRDCQERPRRW